MDRRLLIHEIIKTCQYFKVIEKDINYAFVEKKIIDGLEDIIFVENLLKVLYNKINQKRFKKHLNNSKIKNLLIELEKIRLNLEFKEVI